VAGNLSERIRSLCADRNDVTVAPERPAHLQRLPGRDARPTEVGP